MPLSSTLIMLCCHRVHHEPCLFISGCSRESLSPHAVHSRHPPVDRHHDFDVCLKFLFRSSRSVVDTFYLSHCLPNSCRTNSNIQKAYFLTTKRSLDPTTRMCLCTCVAHSTSKSLGHILRRMRVRLFSRLPRFHYTNILHVQTRATVKSTRQLVVQRTTASKNRRKDGGGTGI
jgi:hypothetical protein